MSQSRRVLGVVMDPIESIKPKKDSTLAMLREAGRRGSEVTEGFEPRAASTWGYS